MKKNGSDRSNMTRKALPRANSEWWLLLALPLKNVGAEEILMTYANFSMATPKECRPLIGSSLAVLMANPPKDCSMRWRKYMNC
jgi:hypothetical protein